MNNRSFNTVLVSQVCRPDLNFQYPYRNTRHGGTNMQSQQWGDGSGRIPGAH